jgi:hypothetical protein
MTLSVLLVSWLRLAACTLLPLFALASLAPSQEHTPPSVRGLAGTYQMKEMNGSPIAPDATYRLHFVPIVGTPFFLGMVTRDAGEGPEIVPGDDHTIFAMPSGNDYEWISASETFGGTLTTTRYGYHMEYSLGDGDEMRLERE